MLKILLISLAILLANCGNDEQPQTETNSQNNSIIDNLTPALDDSFDSAVRNIMLAYLNQIKIDYDNLSVGLVEFREQVEAFLEEPQSIAMDRMRDSWLSAHSSYELTSLHRYFFDLILPEPESLILHQLHYQMDHWPILPGYMDYVRGYNNSGIVNDINVTLDIASLEEQHGAFDISEATLGFHVLEFLIWGENKDRRSERPPSDYVLVHKLNADNIENGISLEQLSSNRRRQILSLTVRSLNTKFSSSQVIRSEGSESLKLRLNDIRSTELVILLIDSINNMLNEEILLKTLYPLLNGNYEDSIQAAYSHSSPSAVSAQLSSVEQLLLELTDSDGERLATIFAHLSQDFEEFFFQNFDSSKRCLALLYSTLGIPEELTVNSEKEFEIVECINLVANMVDYLQQVKISLSESN